MNCKIKRGCPGLAALFGLTVLVAVLASGCDSAVSDILQRLASGDPIAMAFIGDEKLEDDGSISFGNTIIGDRVTLAVRLENIGAGKLTLLGVTIGGEDSASFPIVDDRSTPLDIGPAASIDFSLGFQPTSVKACVAIVTFSTNDPDSPTLSLTLSGTGLAVNKMSPGLANFSDMIKNYGDAAFIISSPPSSSSNGQITYSSGNTGVATISGTTVTIHAAGTSIITASQAETDIYAAGSITATLTVNPIPPTLGNFGAMSKNYGDAAFAPTAPTSNSSGAFSYSSGNTAVATSNGSTLTIVGVGTSTITATQAAAGNHTSASTTATLTVSAILPTVTTTSISSIRAASATGGGNVTSGGGATVSARGVCWSTSTNPTTASSHTTDSSGTGSFASSLTGLTVGTTYYVRAYATNSVGTRYGSQVSFQAVWAVGDTNWGGKIVSISGTYPNQHGLVFCENDLGSAYWSMGLTGVNPNANSTTDGLANTNSIVTSQGAGTYAAKICSDLSYNGYNDWYLPAKDQMTILYNARGYLSNFTDDNYWSSTQWATTMPYTANEFNYPGFTGRTYATNRRVRAVRNF